MNRTCLPSWDDTNTGSPASLSRIKAWLHICSNLHPACAQPDSQPPPLPTRVIAVGVKGSSKCYLLSGMEKFGYYATLSHCWGDPYNRPLLTTEQTLSCHQQGIEDEALPKTFRHAVQVCRELGIEYIWIDSLCIIQEQETQEDWAKEAPGMGHVYGNSTLNISAAAAADSTQGCFKERLGLISWPCPVLLFGQACYLFRSPTEKEVAFGDPGDIGWDLSNVLARRAWTLQEQILSRRSIIFSKNLLIWRCPTLSANEKYPLGIPHLPPNTSVDNPRLLQCIINGITSSLPKDQTGKMYDCWYKIVEEFTSRELTYERDRLPAIAGVAKRFGRAVNDSYHAGLWRNDMIFGLLWHAEDFYCMRTRESPARAPSWSWASINCHVNYSRNLVSHDHNGTRLSWTPLVNILDIMDPTTCKDHPFGVTSRATLSLSGVLLAVIQNEHYKSMLDLVDNKTASANIIHHFFPDVSDYIWPAKAPLFCLPIYIRHSSDHLDIYKLDQASWERLLKTRTNELETNKLYCLVLEAIKGHEDTYSRVGLSTVGKDKTVEMSRMAVFGERRSITLI